MKDYSKEFKDSLKKYHMTLSQFWDMKEAYDRMNPCDRYSMWRVEDERIKADGNICT